MNANTQGLKEGVGVAFRGMSEAMDGRSQAHMDVLEAVPRKATPTPESPEFSSTENRVAPNTESDRRTP